MVVLIIQSTGFFRKSFKGGAKERKR